MFIKYDTVHSWTCIGTAGNGDEKPRFYISFEPMTFLFLSQIEEARIKSDWAIRLPQNLSPLDAAKIGTAGYTAMLCLQVAVISSLSPDIVSFESPVLCSRDRDCRLHCHALPSGSINI
jgi:hypothetical protein